MVLERVDAGRGDDAGLPHRAAEEVLRAAGGGHQLRRARDERAERAAEPLREAERDDVDAAPDLRRRDAERRGGVDDAGAVEVDAQVELAGGLDDGVDLGERPHAAARGVVGVLDRDDARARHVRRGVAADGAADLLGRDPATVPGQAAHDEPAEDGRAALLVEEDVRGLLGEQLVARLGEDPQRDLVRHRRRRQEDRLLLAEERGGAPLELVDGRVLALLLVADLRVRDRRAHRLRRPRGRVGAEVDHGRARYPLGAWEDAVMRYGLSLASIRAFADVRNVVRAAVVAEEAGWEAFFVWDHLRWAATGEGSADPWVALGACAQATSRIQLGTAVTPLPRRRPQMVAQQLASLSLLSGGRVIFGAGIGGKPDEFTRFGDPGDDRTRGGDARRGARARGRAPVGPAGRAPRRALPSPTASRSRPCRYGRCRSGSAATRGRRCAGRSAGAAGSPTAPTRNATSSRPRRSAAKLAPVRVEEVAFIGFAGQADLASYAAAGVTWWIENVSDRARRRRRRPRAARRRPARRDPAHLIAATVTPWI